MQHLRYYPSPAEVSNDCKLHQLLYPNKNIIQGQAVCGDLKDVAFSSSPKLSIFSSCTFTRNSTNWSHLGV